MSSELNVARLEGVLNGSTSEERFESFVERLRQPEVILALLEEYPVMARQLMTCIDQWVTFGLAFLEHLLSDWEAIRTTFKIETNPGVLVEVNGGAGDRHRGGRSVLLLRFSSGLRLVYKPRSLAVDAHFQELLTWLNQRGNHPSFRTLRVLDRGSHGWVEFVDGESCTSPDQYADVVPEMGRLASRPLIVVAIGVHLSPDEAMRITCLVGACQTRGVWRAAGLS